MLNIQLERYRRELYPDKMPMLAIPPTEEQKPRGWTSWFYSSAYSEV